MSTHVCKCSDGPHPSYGACLRAKNIGFSGVFETRTGGHSHTTDQKHYRRLEKYWEARRQGIRPDGTKEAQVERAVKVSDTRGTAYDCANPLGA